MNRTVQLLDGSEANCVYDVDDHGFILFALHGCEGDLTEITDAEYDHVEAQCLTPTIAPASDEG